MQPCLLELFQSSPGPKDRSLPLGFPMTLLLVAAGLAIGIPTAVAASRLLASQLYGVRAGDPLTLAGATALMMTVVATRQVIYQRAALRVSIQSKPSDANNPEGTHDEPNLRGSRNSPGPRITKVASFVRFLPTLGGTLAKLLSGDSGLG